MLKSNKEVINRDREIRRLKGEIARLEGIREDLLGLLLKEANNAILEPCPLCKSKKNLTVYASTGGEQGNTRLGNMVTIRCTDCNCSLTAYDLKTLIKKWNNRKDKTND